MSTPGESHPGGWVLAILAFLLTSYATVSALRLLILRASCAFSGHLWPEGRPSSPSTIRCLSCGKTQVVGPTNPCAECRHAWIDHQDESPDGACAAFPCTCRSYQAQGTK